MARACCSTSARARSRGWPGWSIRRASMRSSSATSTPITSSTSCRCATTCAGSASPARIRVAGPAGLADRLDALHVEPGFSAVAFDIEPLAEGIVRPSDRSGRRRAGDAHGRQLRVPRLARRPTRTGRPRLLGRLRPRRGPRRPRPARRHAALRGLVRAGSGRSRARSTSTARRSGIWPRGCAAGRVLLTHLQMGYDRDATVESVRRRYDGGRSSSSTRVRDDDRRLTPGSTAALDLGAILAPKRPRHPTRGGAPRSDAARGRGA